MIVPASPIYLERYQLGDWVDVPILCVNASGVPTNPDNAPRLTVYDSSGSEIETRRAGRADPGATTGYFNDRIHLDSAYSTGEYLVLVRWYNTTGTYYGYDIFTFEVLAGGDADGSVIAIHNLERPDGNFVLFETDGGAIKYGRNPYVA